MSVSFSPKQLQVLAFGNTNYDAIICDGSIRSGKSSAESIAFVLDGMSRYNNQNFIIASQSVSSAERNIIKPLLAIKYMRQNFDINYVISNRCLTVKRGRKVNYFYVFGGKDESSYATVQGITAAGAFLDEVVLMPESFVNQVLARCSVDGAKFWFSCNPSSPSHWFKRDWIDRYKDKNALYLHFTMEDNPSLSEAVKERYRSMYSGVFHDRYILGKWVKAEGIIYRNFIESKSKHVISQLPSDIVAINVGLDFGGNKSSTSMVAVGIIRNYAGVVVLESKRITEELSPETLDAYFVEFCRMVYDKYSKVFVVRADNAEPVLMRGIKNAVMRNDVPANVKPALKRPILSRIKLVNKLTGLGRFQVMSHCTSVINALEEALWDDKKTDTRLDDGTTDIDTLDALEYAIEEFMYNLIDNVEGGSDEENN